MRMLDNDASHYISPTNKTIHTEAIMNNEVFHQPEIHIWFRSSFKRRSRWMIASFHGIFLFSLFPVLSVILSIVSLGWETQTNLLTTECSVVLDYQSYWVLNPSLHQTESDTPPPFYPFTKPKEFRKEREPAQFSFFSVHWVFWWTDR